MPVSLGNSSLSDSSEEIRRIRDQMGEIDEPLTSSLTYLGKVRVRMEQMMEFRCLVL